MKLRALSAWCGICESKLRRAIKDPDHPLPAFKIKGTILVKISDFNRWIEHFRISEENLDQIVNGVIEGLSEDFLGTKSTVEEKNEESRNQPR